MKGLHRVSAALLSKNSAIISCGGQDGSGLWSEIQGLERVRSVKKRKNWGPRYKYEEEGD